MIDSGITSGTRVVRGAAFILAFAFAGVAQGAQIGSQFHVTVGLQAQARAQAQPLATGSSLCRFRNMSGGAFGAMVTVVCATGVVVEIWPPGSRSSWAPTHGSSYRFLPPVSLAGVMSGSLDMNTGLGTVTSWRVIKMADRDFLEMTVRW